MPNRLSDGGNDVDVINDGAQHAAPLVVGIGASAGGLGAISEILGHLPADTGMAFVVVQHLAPEGPRSLLHEVLGRATSLSVTVADDGSQIESNHVYVIPPNHQLTIAQGQLQLVECDQSQGRVKTIDVFFKSLAEDRRNRAIAILLSGSNNDGSAGIEAIRAAGGITIAQDPSTAEFTEMPRSAIATGAVDKVLAPWAIAQELIEISQHPYLCEPLPETSESSSFREEDLAPIFGLLKNKIGINFSTYRRTTFGRRLKRRMALHSISDLNDYIQYLRDHSSEVDALYRDVLISVTSFFRDKEVYQAVNERIIPSVWTYRSSAQPTQSIRFWVPGCASGEEVYSLAICLLEWKSQMNASPSIQIFGTDINDQAIEEARLGIYRESRLENVSTERRRLFFTEVDGGYQIKKAVRELCIFARHDLGSDPPFSDLDLVSCRNVLIYFQPALQQRVLSVFHYSLRPSGFLVLGNAESVGNTSELFSIVDSDAKIYTRKAVSSRLNLDFVNSSTIQQTTQHPKPFSTSWENSNFQAWADQIIINRYAPAGIVINEKLDILQFRGDISPYLRPAPGEPSFNLMKMLRPTLLVEVQAIITQAKQQNIAAKRQIDAREETQQTAIALEVIPFSTSMSQEQYFLILFERESTNESTSYLSSNAQTQEDSVSEIDDEIRRLRQELSTTRQELLDTQTFLQLTIENQEATNQQLITANEEILSSNEELKSTNEELQTAKEEVQSSNEELKTTNDELERRNDEARRAHDDIINLVGNVNIPILMLSSDLRIRRFTPSARGIFKLIPSDVGRPITDFRLDINVPDLEALIVGVLESLNSQELEVQDNEGHWYLLRIRPYRTIDNHIDGVVLVLIDIDNLKRTTEQLAIARSYAERIVEMMPIPLVVLDMELCVQTINQAFCEAFQISSDTISHQIYRSFFELGHGEWNIPELRSHLYALLSHLSQLHNIEIEHTFERIGHKTLLLNARSISHDDENRNIILAIEDITDRKRAEANRLQLMQEQAARSQAEAANASKDEFLSMLSHELRTPLTNILGWAELFTNSDLHEDDLNRAVDEIRRSSILQLRLIEDLLDISRMSQGRLLFRLEPTDIAAIVQRAIEHIRPQAMKKVIHLNAEVNDTGAPIHLDPVRIEQVLLNLLSNAVNFTPSGGRIDVSLTDSESHIQIQVRDTGHGISSADLPYIFDRFRRVDMSDTREASGLGLGLYIVRYIVEAHEGTVTAESPGLGQGATFTVMLPKQMADSPTVSERPLPLEATNERATLRGIRILLVEDNDDNATVISIMLRVNKAEVVRAASAPEAMDIIIGQAVDVIVSDIGLPEVNGYDLIRQVRTLPPEQGGEIPAIALTAHASEDDAQAAIDAGFQMHLTKPIDSNELVRAIYTLLRA